MNGDDDQVPESIEMHALNTSETQNGNDIQSKDDLSQPELQQNTLDVGGELSNDPNETSSLNGDVTDNHRGDTA